jgi:NDP-sugar pyrophosphorylase family protein
VNAGIYVIEPEVLQLISDNRKVSLEREIFPVLAKEGRLSGFEFSGYWFDIGNLTDFRRANFSLLHSSTREPERQAQGAKIATDAVIRRPALFGDNSSVDSEAMVGPNAILGNMVSIGKRAEVTQSILFDRVTVGDHSRIHGAILAADVKVGGSVRIGRGCIISPHVTIADGTRIAAGAIIHPHKEINRSVGAKAHIM